MGMEAWHSILSVLPEPVRVVLGRVGPDVASRVEEIRLRENRALEIVYKGGFGFVTATGSIVRRPEEAFCPTREDSLQFLDLLSNHSLYTMEEELRQGFVTIRGGHRVGLAGRTVLEKGEVKQIRHVGSFNIRLAREVRGAAVPVLPWILDHRGKTVFHTLIVSPPQQGKTTVIRDVSRLISEGAWPAEAAGWEARKVGIVDERSELAACYQGVPRFDVGPRTDVLDGCPKAEGMMMMIRSMSPEVLVVDEIGRPEDAVAVEEAAHAGIRVLATAHGTGVNDVWNRPAMKQLANAGVFDRYVILGTRTESGTSIRGVWDKKGEPVRKLRPAGV